MIKPVVFVDVSNRFRSLRARKAVEHINKKYDPAILFVITPITVLFILYIALRLYYGA
jgi:hypothetical protein